MTLFGFLFRFGVIQHAPDVERKLLPLATALAAAPVVGPCLARLVPMVIHRYLNLRDPGHAGACTAGRPIGGCGASVERHRGLYVIRGVK
ncbi:hypothetical protein [Nonomuraea sp. NPDC049400]|uniref:hypothetical protein n=1 Tax=Nonomuraea sp. NPDC049400 TaxID=3364352 RepID=UPI0037B19BFF